jgi:methylamine---glutamate N-methyltransferase subunit A
MCGIAGYWEKSGAGPGAVGETVLGMLGALGCRGPDSAGVALYGEAPAAGRGLVLRVKLGERGDLGAKGERIAAHLRERGWLRSAETTHEYLRLEVDFDGDPRRLERTIEALDEGLEVVSLGRRLEIVKQVGSPQQLDATYGVSRFRGTHGIGHTRLSTESRVDLSHSQPFWAHGVPDLAIVHNGHITNYHVLRRRYEQRGVRFYTENDSEIVGVYVGERLAEGEPLEVALRASLRDLDGSYSYLAATADALGFAKDPFALKPLLVAETEQFVAVANEEIAIRAAFPGTYEAREAQAKEVRVWQRSPKSPRSPATASPRETSTPRSSARSRGAQPAFA